MTTTHDPITAAKLEAAKLQAKLIEAEAKYASLLAATHTAAECGDLAAKMAEGQHLTEMQLRQAHKTISALEEELVQTGEALAELVELKRMHDAAGGNATLEYAQRKPHAWDRAYKQADRFNAIRVRD